MIDQTSCNFATSPERDHFGIFSDELLQLNIRIALLPELGLTAWSHYAGVTDNYKAVYNGRLPYYQPEQFRQFVQMSLDVPVEQDPRFVTWSKKCLGAI